MWPAACAPLGRLATVLALLSFAAGQLDSYYPYPRPSSMPVSLMYLNGLLSGSVCGDLANFGCVTRIDTQVELPPLVYLPPPTYFESRRCIGWDSACNWPNISAYIDSGAGDTDEYILTGLNITLPTASQAFLMGSRPDAAQITNYLTHINVTCTAAYPVYATHIIDKIVDMASGVARDGTSMDGAPGPVLQSVVVRGCLLTGGVPASLSQLPQLEYLDLSGNHLDGGLAPEWDGASMRLVNLSSNALSGLLPASGTWVRLGACGAVLDLSNNNLHGGIPSSWLESACSTDSKTNTSISATDLAAVQQDRGGPYATQAVCSLPASTCNIDGIALDAPSPSDPLVQTATVVPPPSVPSPASPPPPSPPLAPNTSSPPTPPPPTPPSPSQPVTIINEGGTNVLLSPFPFSVLLWGNPNLQRPTAHSRYAVAFVNGTRFAIASNACTDSGYTLAELVGMWLAAFIGGLLIGALPAAGQRWRRRSKVAPAPGPTPPSLPTSVPTPPPAPVPPPPLPPPPPLASAEVDSAEAAESGGTALPRAAATLVSPNGHGGAPVDSALPPLASTAMPTQPLSSPGPPDVVLRAPAATLGDAPGHAATATGAGAPLPPLPPAVGPPQLEGGWWDAAVLCGLVLWCLAFTGTALASTATLAAPQRRAFCTARLPCLPEVYLAPALLLLVPMGLAATLVLLLLRAAQERHEDSKDSHLQPQRPQQDSVAWTRIPRPQAVAEGQEGLQQGQGEPENPVVGALSELDSGTSGPSHQQQGKGEGRSLSGSGTVGGEGAASSGASSTEGLAADTRDAAVVLLPPLPLGEGDEGRRGAAAQGIETTADVVPSDDGGGWLGSGGLPAWWQWRVLVRQHLLPTWSDLPLAAGQWAVLALVGTFALPLLMTLGMVSQGLLAARWAWAWVWYEPPPPPSAAADSARLTAASRLLWHRTLWIHIEALSSAMYLCTGLVSALPLAVVMGYLVAQARVWGLGSRTWYPEVRAMFFVAWFTLGAIIAEAALGWVVARRVLGRYPAKLCAAWEQRCALSKQRRQVQRQLAAEAGAAAANDTAAAAAAGTASHRQ